MSLYFSDDWYPLCLQRNGRIKSQSTKVLQSSSSWRRCLPSSSIEAGWYWYSYASKETLCKRRLSPLQAAPLGVASRSVRHGGGRLDDFNDDEQREEATGLITVWILFGAFIVSVYWIQKEGKYADDIDSVLSKVMVTILWYHRLLECTTTIRIDNAVAAASFSEPIST